MFLSALPRMVKSNVVTLCGADHNVFRAIVGFVSVDVMHNLRSLQIAAKSLFCNKPMFVNATVLVRPWMIARCDNSDVTVLGQRATAIPSGILCAALMVAEHVQRAILASSRDDGSAAAPAWHCHRAIARLGARQEFVSVLQVIRASVFSFVQHNPIVTHSVCHYTVSA